MSAIIDLSTQFIGISPDVNMQEKKSTLANSPTQVYTMDDITTTVLEYVPQGPTEVSIPIESADILTLGTSPIELLEAPGEGNYYIIERVVVEYNYRGIAYVFPTSPTLSLTGCFKSFIENKILTSTTDALCIISGNLTNTITVGSGSGSVKVISTPGPINSGLYLQTTDSDNPTTGDGTLNVKITFRVAAFG
jgi:hypothetical protein